MSVIVAWAAVCLLQPPADQNTVKSLIAQLKSKEAKAKIEAAEKLQKLGADAVDASKALCEACTDRRPGVQSAALHALEVVNPKLHKPIKILCIDKSPEEHDEALKDLKSIPFAAAAAGPFIASYMLASIESRDPRAGIDFVRADMAAQTYAAICPTEPEAIKTLSMMVKRHPNHKVVATCYEHLGNIGDNKIDLQPQVIDILKTGLQMPNTSDETRIVIIHQIPKQGDSAIKLVPILQTLNDKASSKPLRDAAAEAIAKIKK